jgi:hypothetical protein
VQKSFQEMRDLGASLEEPDPDFTRSGLVFAVGPDGTSEMVAADVKALYEQHGAACIGLSEKELFAKEKQLLLSRLEEAGSSTAGTTAGPSTTVTQQVAKRPSVAADAASTTAGPAPTPRSGAMMQELQEMKDELLRSTLKLTPRSTPSSPRKRAPPVCCNE